MHRFTEAEIQWLNDEAIGNSHQVSGGTNLAACDSCEWTAGADTFEYLMEQVTKHLEQTYHFPTSEEAQSRRTRFIAQFGWDPWEEGEMLAGTMPTPDSPPVLFDNLSITEMDEEGTIVSESHFSKEINPGEFEE